MSVSAVSDYLSTGCLAAAAWFPPPHEAVLRAALQASAGSAAILATNSMQQGALLTQARPWFSSGALRLAMCLIQSLAVARLHAS